MSPETLDMRTCEKCGGYIFFTKTYLIHNPKIIRTFEVPCRGCDRRYVISTHGEPIIGYRSSLR